MEIQGDEHLMQLVVNMLSHLNFREKSFIAFFVLVKILLLIQFPLTGDEAYFITWGQQLSLGYYDHPPVVGWVTYALSYIHDSYFVYRSFAFISAIVISVIIYKLILQIKDKQTALLVSLIYFTSPASLLTAILTNDVVLVLFGLLGFYFLTKALTKKSLLLSLLAGTFLGLTFLSKYLSVLMFVGFIAYLLFNRNKVSWKVVFVTLVMVLLFAIENIYFNINSCWNNIVFNLYSRTKDEQFDLANVIMFFVFILIVVPPQGVYRLLNIRLKTMPQFLHISLFVVLSFFIGLFFVSFNKKIGLHWLVLCIPFVYLFFSQLTVLQLKGLLKYNVIFSSIVGLTLVCVSTFHGQLLGGMKKYPRFILYLETPQFCDAMPKHKVIFTTGYSANSVLSQHCKNNEFHVMFDTSKYGREDDKRIDFNQFSGQNMSIFTTDKKKIETMKPYFDSLVIKRVKATEKSDYYLVEGSNFNFEKYKQEILFVINEQFYKSPDWLPQAQCRFKDKYAL